MPLIRHGEITADTFRVLEDCAPRPEGEPVIVSLTRWQKERDTLIARNAAVGVALKSSEAPAALAGDLDRIALVAIEFPSFRDGRGFSYAYRLRAQMGFAGELRAFGHLLPDQAQFLTRCGFDSIVVKDDAKLSDWVRGLSEFTVFYQDAAVLGPTAIHQRHRRAAAE